MRHREAAKSPVRGPCVTRKSSAHAQLLRITCSARPYSAYFRGSLRGTLVAEAMRAGSNSRIRPRLEVISYMTSIKQQLADDHVQLERRLRRLSEAIEANDSCADLRRVWSGFEANLLDHLGTEERCLFPMVASEHRAEVEQLRAEHQHIRCALAELGVCVELHTLRKQAVDELADFLRHHAAREDASLYGWVEQGKSSLPPLRGMLAMFERHGVHNDSKPPPA